VSDNATAGAATMGNFITSVYNQMKTYNITNLTTLPAVTMYFTP